MNTNFDHQNNDGISILKGTEVRSLTFREASSVRLHFFSKLYTVEFKQTSTRLLGLVVEARITDMNLIEGDSGIHCQIQTD